MIYQLSLSLASFLLGKFFKVEWSMKIMIDVPIM